MRAAGGAGGRGKADRDLRLDRLLAGEQQHPAIGKPLQQAAEGVELGAAQRPRPGSARATDLGEDGGSPAAEAHHIRSGAEMPSRSSEAAIVRFASRHSASRERSTPSPSASSTWQSR